MVNAKSCNFCFLKELEKHFKLKEVLKLMHLKLPNNLTNEV